MKKVFSFLLAFLPFVIVFIGSLYASNDPDLGWHLKYGEYFFKTGHIIRNNPFSTMMPDFHFANVSWGTDILTYAIYHSGGFFGLTVVSALIATLTFFFFSKAANLTLWDQIFLFPLLLYLELPVNAVSFRGQQISLMFFGILFYIIRHYKEHPNKLYLTIPLFLIWVNLNGEFLLGIFLFFVWIVSYSGQKLISLLQEYSNEHEGYNAISIPTVVKRLHRDNKEIILLIMIFVVSFAVTFINPFGAGIHLDAASYIGNPMVKNIAEFLPFPSLSQAWWNQVIVAVLLGMGLVYLFFKEKLLVQLPTIFSILLLFILSFSVRRYAWPAYYLILPILKPIPGFFKPDSKKVTNISAVILLIILLAMTILPKLPLQNFHKFSWNNYCSHPFILCSPRSAQYLIDHKLTDGLYSLYGWGGYLMWNYPEIKPTIDGRMHMWRDEKGYSGFEDYFSYEQNMKDIDNSKYKVVYMSPDKPVYNRMMELVNSGKWKIAYRDERAGIFRRL